MLESKLVLQKMSALSLVLRLLSVPAPRIETCETQENCILFSCASDAWNFAYHVLGRQKTLQQFSIIYPDLQIFLKNKRYKHFNPPKLPVVNFQLPKQLQKYRTNLDVPNKSSSAPRISVQEKQARDNLKDFVKMVSDSASFDKEVDCNDSIKLNLSPSLTLRLIAYP
eukprot:m.86470 g.86470  ORF g.86470 m.86470 type:complete len:168 (-) comp13057_c0_seq8:8-511(-)